MRGERPKHKICKITFIKSEGEMAHFLRFWVSRDKWRHKRVDLPKEELKCDVCPVCCTLVSRQFRTEFIHPK